MRSTANNDSAATDIFSKLQDSDIQESFKAVVDYISEHVSGHVSSQPTDPTLQAIGGFLSAAYQEIAPNKIHDPHALSTFVLALNPLIGCVVDYLAFCLDNYRNGSDKNWNVARNVRLKKNFEGIKKGFEEANQNLIDTVGAVTHAIIANMATQMNDFQSGMVKMQESLAIQVAQQHVAATGTLQLSCVA
ncbi:UNVERIFIED_CONTAM: hypothetical protein HDU68_002750 [Siphonaria sp. JEL0065]|nr:hypothetical protein HDU68_002750 [Siphonaria sp. JEL0065]